MKKRTLFFTAALAAMALAGAAQAPDSRNNLASCLNGLPGCDISLLSAADVKSVSEAGRARNFNACMKGLFSCDPSRLTSDEATQVSTMYVRRNAKACIDGLVSCDPARLTQA